MLHVLTSEITPDCMQSTTLAHACWPGKCFSKPSFDSAERLLIPCKAMLVEAYPAKAPMSPPPSARNASMAELESTIAEVKQHYDQRHLQRHLKRSYIPCVIVSHRMLLSRNFAVEPVILNFPATGRWSEKLRYIAMALLHLLFAQLHDIKIDVTSMSCQPHAR